MSTLGGTKLLLPSVNASDLDGDESPAESGDESPHSKAPPVSHSRGLQPARHGGDDGKGELIDRIAQAARVLSCSTQLVGRGSGRLLPISVHKLPEI